MVGLFPARARWVTMGIPAVMAALWRTFALILPFLMVALNGCYAGVAAVVVGVVALSGGGGGGGADSPPVIAFAGEPYRTDGGRVLVQYDVSDDSAGEIDVEVLTKFLYCGDAGWERPSQVVDGRPVGLILSPEERAWLEICWRTARS